MHYIVLSISLLAGAPYLIIFILVSTLILPTEFYLKPPLHMCTQTLNYYSSRNIETLVPHELLSDSAVLAS